MTPDHVPESAPPDLRPMGVGEILDAALRLARQNLGTYFKLVVLFMALPLGITAIYAASHIVFVANGLLFVDDPDSYNVWITVLMFASLFVQLLCFGVLVHLSTRLYMNKNETAGSILRASRGRFWSFVGMSVILGLYAWGISIVIAIVGQAAALLALLVAVVIFIWWGTTYSLTVPAFWHEEARAMESIWRSRAMVKGRFWQVFGSLFVGFIIVAVVQLGIGAITGLFTADITTPVPYVITDTALDFIGTTVSLIALAPIVTVVYFDGKVRIEGFDLTLKLDQAADEEPPPPVPW